jgi:hypothetical protein
LVLGESCSAGTTGCSFTGGSFTGRGPSPQHDAGLASNLLGAADARGLFLERLPLESNFQAGPSPTCNYE